MSVILPTAECQFLSKLEAAYRCPPEMVKLMNFVKYNFIETDSLAFADVHPVMAQLSVYRVADGHSRRLPYRLAGYPNQADTSIQITLFMDDQRHVYLFVGLETPRVFKLINHHQLVEMASPVIALGSLSRAQAAEVLRFDRDLQWIRT